MVEYKRRQSEVEDELEDTISETVSNEAPEDDAEEEYVYLRKPRKFIECPICFGLGSKVADHDHAIPKDNVRGAAHTHCNRQYKRNQFKIPIWVHNGLDYYFHFVFREIGYHKNKFQEEDNNFPPLKPIAKSEMNFVYVSWGNFVFLD